MDAPSFKLPMLFGGPGSFLVNIPSASSVFFLSAPHSGTLGSPSLPRGPGPFEAETDNKPHVGINVEVGFTCYFLETIA